MEERITVWKERRNGMKLTKKENVLSVSYRWELDEITTEKQCLVLVAKIAEIGELKEIEFHGYEDMDEHGNWASFDTVEEYKKGIPSLGKIEPDTATVIFKFDGDNVSVTINPLWDNENGTRMRMNCLDEDVAEKVAKILEEKVKEVSGK